MRKYELVVLLHPDLEIDVDTPITKIEKIIETAGGKVTKRDNWGKRKLAYRIKHQDFAVYVFFEVMVEPAGVQKIEHDILLTEEVMRHIVVLSDQAESASKAEPVAKAKATKEG